MADKEIHIPCTACQGAGTVSIKGNTQTGRDKLVVLARLEAGPMATAVLWQKMPPGYRRRRTRSALNQLLDRLAAAGLVTRTGGTKGHGRAIVWELARGGEA